MLRKTACRRPKTPTPWPQAPTGLPRVSLCIAGRTQQDLSRCVVMLVSESVETLEVDGEVMEVWLKPRGAGRATPKLTRQLGSGFLVAADSDAFLVTAAHVARRMDGAARFLFSTRTGKRRVIALADLLHLDSATVPWRFHARADVAAVRIRELPRALYGHCLPAELLQRKKLAPGGGIELLLIGFPLGLVSEPHFAPIAKRSHAASEIVRFRGDEMRKPADFFLIDQPAMAGYSGAPVFLAPDDQASAAGAGEAPAVRCVGLVSQTISDEAGGQFGAIVPSADVRRAIAAAGRGRCARGQSL